MLQHLYTHVFIFVFCRQLDAEKTPSFWAMAYQFVSDIYASVLNHKLRKAFPTKTYLYCTIDGVDDYFCFENTAQYRIPGGVHAEKKLIDELKTNTKVSESKMPSYTGSDLDITVYMNNSPCSTTDHDCKKRLNVFLKEYKRVRMTLYITSIHNVYRRSCQRNNHNHYVYDDINKESSVELWNLMQHDRCVISAYSFEVWKKLFDLVKLPKKPLRKYAKTLRDQEHDISRKDEDKRIGDDLAYIGRSRDIHS